MNKLGMFLICWPLFAFGWFITDLAFQTKQGMQIFFAAVLVIGSITLGIYLMCEHIQKQGRK